MKRKIIGVTVGTPLNPEKFGGAFQEQIDQNKKDIESLNREKLSADALPEAVNDAIAQAKASGEFDGKDGKNGKDGQDGYTPVKGVDYFDGVKGVDGKDGYTPQKGIDYFDGQDGKNGVDGKDGYTPIKGVDYFDGDPGEPGKSGVYILSSGESIENAPADADVVIDPNGESDIDIPTGGGGESEWKQLAYVEFTEDGVTELRYTTDENGEPLSVTDLTLRVKAAKRTDVSSLKIYWLWEADGVLGASSTIYQINAFGNTSKDMYYIMQSFGECGWRKNFVSEIGQDLFTPRNNTYQVANNVYQSGVSYYTPNVTFPMNYFAVVPAKGFATGDIVEIWYR